MANFSNRFGRQYGIVHQDAVEDLNVLIAGDSEILPYLLLNLAFSGVGCLRGGVYLTGCAATVVPRHTSAQFVLKSEDIGAPLVAAYAQRLKRFCPRFDLQPWPDSGLASLVPDVTVVLPPPGQVLASPTTQSTRVYGQVTPAGVYVGHEPMTVPPFEPNVFTACLASLAGAILAQDVLRLGNTIRSVAVIDQELQVSLRLRSPGIERYFALPEPDRSEIHHGINAALRLGGETLRVQAVRGTDRRDEGIFTAALPRETLLSRMLLDSIEIEEEPLVKRAGIRPPLLVSLFGGERLVDGRLTVSVTEYPRCLESLRATVVGVGGLGTWVTGLLAATPAQRCCLAIVDADDRVEEHNLNRQILYDDNDIGIAKVRAARDALLEIRPDLEVHAYQAELKEPIVRYIRHGVSLPYADIDGPGQGPAPVDRSSMQSAMLARDLAESQALLSCLDNMKSRWVLNGAAHLLGKVFVNGGVGGLYGTADYIDPGRGDASMTTRYGDGMKTDTGKVQCGGSVPIPSIVTTNAVVASLQGALAVAAALGLAPAANYFCFDGQGREYWETRCMERNGADPLGMNTLIEELES